MALLLESAMRARALKATSVRKTAGTLLYERMETQGVSKPIDIFMSHAFEDKELVLGTVLYIEDMGYSVYLDWRDDPLLDRKKVNSKTSR